MEAKKLQPHTDNAVRAVLPCVMQQMEFQNPRMLDWGPGARYSKKATDRETSDQQRILKALHPGKRILAKIPTPALPPHTHTHCCSSLSPYHFPIFTFPLLGSPKGSEFTLEPKEFQMERRYSWKQQNTHNTGNRDLQGIAFCFPHAP